MFTELVRPDKKLPANGNAFRMLICFAVKAKICQLLSRVLESGSFPLQGGCFFCFSNLVTLILFMSSFCSSFCSSNLIGSFSNNSQHTDFAVFFCSSLCSSFCSSRPPHFAPQNKLASSPSTARILTLQSFFVPHFVPHESADHCYEGFKQAITSVFGKAAPNEA